MFSMHIGAFYYENSRYSSVNFIKAREIAIMNGAHHDFWWIAYESVEKYNERKKNGSFAFS